MIESKRIACIGAGLIGQGWATCFAAKGCDVVLHDTSETVLENAMQNVKSNLRVLAKNSPPGELDPDSAAGRIEPTADLAQACGQTGYIQESVVEQYDAKKRVFAQIDASAPNGAIIASSTSGLLMSEIQQAAARPERCVLAHPYLPVHLIPLVEVAGGRQTSPEALAATFELMRKIGKTPVMLKREVPGFIVNRLQAALLREAIDLVDSGVADAEDVDRAFKLSSGLRSPFLGPLLRAHLAGDGIERFFENYSGSYRARLESMANWSAFPDRAVRAVTKSVNEMEMVRTKSLDEIKQWRDDMLAAILSVVNERPHISS